MYLTEQSFDEIAALLDELGQPRYRARQVYAWLTRGVRPSDMTDLPKALRGRLQALPFGAVEIDRKRISARDGTVKYLFALEDGNLIEGVLMRYKYGNTACLSTQVGCRMGCAFCASTLEGCVRSLHAGEMLGQIAAIERDEPAPEGRRTVTNVVLMGSGEPMDNLDNVLRFLRLVTSPDGRNISPRNISVSTCGLLPELERFTEEAPHVTLSVSLHAHDDETRSRIMPVNRVYPIADLLRAAKRYAETTGRRVVFEYALIRGLNAAESDAVALARRLRGINCHVNLIPLNPVPERNLAGATRQEAAAFLNWLTREGVSATVRREMGADIEGACGQLRRRVLHEIRD